MKFELTKTFKYTSDMTEIQLVSDIKIQQNDSCYTLKALWDTGAASTCISSNIAKKLGLISHDYTTMYTTGGCVPVYVFKMNLIMDDIVFEDIEVSEAYFDEVNFDMLIGMDIISRGDFLIANAEGITSFFYRFPSSSDLDFSKLI